MLAAMAQVMLERRLVQVALPVGKGVADRIIVLS
jgi:hypothetical protein